MHAREQVDAHELPLPPLRRAGANHRARPGRFQTLEEARKAYERDYVLKTIEGMDGNMTRTAAALGLERSHLYRKMKALGISTKE